MWVVQFENGQGSSAKKTFWTNLPKDVKLTGLQLQHPALPKKMVLSLSELDTYFFVKEAVSGLFERRGRVVAEIIGGIDKQLGCVLEIRLEETGSVKYKVYPINKLKWEQSIMRDGVRMAEKRKANGKPPKDQLSITNPEGQEVVKINVKDLPGGNDVVDNDTQTSA